MFAQNIILHPISRKYDVLVCHCCFCANIYMCHTEYPARAVYSRFAYRRSPAHGFSFCFLLLLSFAKEKEKGSNEKTARFLIYTKYPSYTNKIFACGCLSAACGCLSAACGCLPAIISRAGRSPLN